MSFSTKTQVLMEILKFEGRPFQPKQLRNELGISNQNLNNHLQRLIKEGVLIRSAGAFYRVTDNERLVKVLADSDSSYSRMQEAKDVVPGAGLIGELQTACDTIVRARILDVEGSTTAHVGMNNMLDDMQRQIKLLRKWLNTKSYSTVKAKEGFDQDYFNRIAEMLDSYE